MKKIFSIMALLYSCVLLASCGSQQESDDTWRGIQAGMDDLSAVTERTEYYDIITESEPIFQWGPGGGESPLSIPRASFAGMQFYQDEPVQLWMEPNLDGYGSAESADICLYRPDGSREIVLRGIGFSDGAKCYLDQDGNCYCWKNSSTRLYSDGSREYIPTCLTKYLASGEVLFDRQLDCDLADLCQTADGRIYLIAQEREEGLAGSRELAEMDPATGLATRISTVRLADLDLSSQELGAWGDKLATYKFQSISGREIMVVNVDDGAESRFLSFTGTSYVPPAYFTSLCDFRILEDESVEILWAALDGSGSVLERLRMANVEKTPIVLRGSSDSWLISQIVSFNQSNETYHVVLEDCGLGNDREDFARLTSVQVAVGDGPDILGGSLMRDYISAMAERGALEDLRPYMEKDGIREEDFFPFAFPAWGDGGRLCAVNPSSPALTSYAMDSAVLGEAGTDGPSMEALVDALLARQEEAAFLAGCDSQELLTLFLSGTDTLWGMVDWEKGSCSFDGELFARMLEVARRYGDNGGRGECPYIAERRNLYDIFFFDSLAERERDGKVICGVLFDDGCHAAATLNSVLAINAGSANKEGAWEFIRFLLGDEAQSASSGVPAGRKAFEAWLEGQREEVADGKEIHIMFYTASSGEMEEVVFTEDDIPEETIAEYVRTLEEACPYPARTAPVLAIISEEAADYFSGSKNAAEVGEVIANRVQLYLNERQ